MRARPAGRARIARTRALRLPYRMSGTTGGAPSRRVMVLGRGDRNPHGYTEVDIQRKRQSSFVYGNPFLLRDAEDAGERNRVCEAYAKLLRTGTPVAAIAREYELDVHPASAGVQAHVRLHALSRLADRVRAGENIALRCACKPRRCHGDTIALWIEARV